MLDGDRDRFGGEWFLHLVWTQFFGVDSVLGFVAREFGTIGFLAFHSISLAAFS